MTFYFRTECKAITPDISDGSWAQKDPATEYPIYPNQTENLLRYKFSNINSTYDVCIEIGYTSLKTVELNLQYTIGSTSIKIANIPLIAKETKGLVDFCLTDFYLNEHEEFNLDLTIKGVESWNETHGFLLESFTPRLQKKRDPVPFLYRWNQNVNESEDNLAYKQYWKAIPETLFKLSQNEPEFSIELSGTNL